MEDVLDINRKSLEEIYVERMSSHMERGTDGMVRQVSRTFKHKLNVKTINAGLRFVHLIVDYFIFVVIVQLLQLIPYGNRYLLTLSSIFALLLYPLFYAIMEYKFQQTPGKMITGHVVINNYAEAPHFNTCLLRSLIRLVPFEGFSCASSPSRGWHDKWSKTYVVPKAEVIRLIGILEKENNSSRI